MDKLLKEFNLSKQTIEKIKRFKDLFLEYNQKVNLTSRSNIENFDLDNIKDSLSIVNFYDFKDNTKVLDIGSGGGFPGIILAIIFPKITFHLVDSNKKKTTWLKFLSQELNLTNVVVLNERVETLENKYQNYFDLIVSRAVAKIPILLELGASYLKVNGKLVFYKGVNFKSELPKKPKLVKEKLGIKLDKIYKWELKPGKERYLVFFKKFAETDSKFPRKFNSIKQNPFK